MKILSLSIGTILLLGTLFVNAAEVDGYFCQMHRGQQDRNAINDFRTVLQNPSNDIQKKYADDPVLDPSIPIVRGCPIAVFQPKINTEREYRGDITLNLQASYTEHRDSPAELICLYEGEEPSRREHAIRKTLVLCAKLRKK